MKIIFSELFTPAELNFADGRNWFIEDGYVKFRDGTKIDYSKSPFTFTEPCSMKEFQLHSGMIDARIDAHQRKLRELKKAGVMPLNAIKHYQMLPDHFEYDFDRGCILQGGVRYPILKNNPKFSVETLLHNLEMFGITNATEEKLTFVPIHDRMSVPQYSVPLPFLKGFNGKTPLKGVSEAYTVDNFGNVRYSPAGAVVDVETIPLSEKNETFLTEDLLYDTVKEWDQLLACCVEVGHMPVWYLGGHSSLRKDLWISLDGYASVSIRGKYIHPHLNLIDVECDGSLMTPYSFIRDTLDELNLLVA